MSGEGLTAMAEIQCIQTAKSTHTAGQCISRATSTGIPPKHVFRLITPALGLCHEHFQGQHSMGDCPGQWAMRDPTATSQAFSGSWSRSEPRPRQDPDTGWFGFRVMVKKKQFQGHSLRPGAAAALNPQRYHHNSMTIPIQPHS